MKAIEEDREILHRTPTGRIPAFKRPYSCKYVNALFARDQRLYSRDAIYVIMNQLICVCEVVVVERAWRLLRNHGDEPRLQEMPLRALPRRRHEDKHGGCGLQSSLRVTETRHLSVGLL